MSEDRPGTFAAPAHYHAVDLLRGIAAITVLVYHYKHFYYAPGTFEVNVPQLGHAMPFYDVLFPVYLFGNGAVQVFWMISGFVFAKVYAGHRTPGRDFLLRRFARLYPLHFVTLVIVAVLQGIALGTMGTWLVYPNNDAWHFALNLAFASTWGLERGFSFNGPIWSVSVEVLVYALFWLVSERLMRRGFVGPLALVAGAGVMLKLGIGTELIWQCAQFFFIGCLLWQIAECHARPLRDLGTVVALAAAAGGLYLAFAPDPRVVNLLMPLAIVLVGGAALIDLRGTGARLRRFGFIGESTYGTYLWHVPLQVAVLLVLHPLGWAGLREHPAFLFAYVLVCCTAGWLSFVWFERPANRAILRWAARRGGASASRT